MNRCDAAAPGNEGLESAGDPQPIGSIREIRWVVNMHKYPNIRYECHIHLAQNMPKYELEKLYLRDGLVDVIMQATEFI